MTRPTLYLTNWSSRSLHGPGRKLCAMAAPRRWERGYGGIYCCSPTMKALREVQRTWDLAEYRFACESWFRSFRGEDDRMRPGELVCFYWGREGTGPVNDGDSLLCACARPGSPKRTHPCHLELLTPFLVRAGWDVVLHGRRVTSGGPGIVLHEEGMGALMPSSVVYAGTPDPFTPEDYGWPEVPR